MRKSSPSVSSNSSSGFFSARKLKRVLRLQSYQDDNASARTKRTDPLSTDKKTRPRHQTDQSIFSSSSLPSSSSASSSSSSSPSPSPVSTFKGNEFGLPIIKERRPRSLEVDLPTFPSENSTSSNSSSSFITTSSVSSSLFSLTTSTDKEGMRNQLKSVVREERSMSEPSIDSFRSLKVRFSTPEYSSTNSSDYSDIENEGSNNNCACNANEKRENGIKEGGEEEDSIESKCVRCIASLKQLIDREKPLKQMKADLEEQLLALITSLNESPFSNIEIVQEATSILKESRQLYSNGGAFVSAILARNETMEERHRDDQKKIKSLEEKLKLLEHEQRVEKDQQIDNLVEESKTIKEDFNMETLAKNIEFLRDENAELEKKNIELHQQLQTMSEHVDHLKIQLTTYKQERLTCMPEEESLLQNEIRIQKKEISRSLEKPSQTDPGSLLLCRSYPDFQLLRDAPRNASDAENKQSNDSNLDNSFYNKDHSTETVKDEDKEMLRQRRRSALELRWKTEEEHWKAQQERKRIERQEKKKKLEEELLREEERLNQKLRENKRHLEMISLDI